MKKSITLYCCATLVGLAFVSTGCTTVDEPESETTTTVTEQTTLRRPVAGASTVETQTYRSY